eukprot:122611-Rhodomonas_salina.2
MEGARVMRGREGGWKLCRESGRLERTERGKVAGTETWGADKEEECGGACRGWGTRRRGSPSARRPSLSSPRSPKRSIAGGFLGQG